MEIPQRENHLNDGDSVFGEQRKKLTFIAWDMDFSESAALVGGMVKNPYYLYKAIGGRFEKNSLSTSKNKSFFNDKADDRVDTNYLAALLKYFIRCFLISRRLKKSYEKPDLIHVHTPALAPIFYDLKGVGVVITAHGTHWPEFKANHKVRGVKSLIVFLNAYFQFLLEKKIYAMADKVISVSEFQVKELVEDYDVASSKIEVIQNGIDYDIYKPPTDPKQKRDVDVLFVGRPVPKKGIGVLISAIKKVNEKIEGSISSSWVFGQGWVSEPNVTEMYADQIRELGGEVLNHVPESDLPAVYCRAKVLVVPSLGYESLPTVLMEGLGCGVVPLASRSFGNIELLTEDFLFSEGSEDEIADRIVDILNDYDAYQEKAKNINLKKYDIKTCVKAHEDLYIKVCNEK
jgi:glycosyltransferase involved in cell wall biosynthesis